MSRRPFSRPSRRSPRAAVLVALALLATSCGQDFGRDDAIVALQNAGASAVEATCIADTLAVLDGLDAARPGVPLSDEGRADLVRARDRCATEVPVGTTGAAGQRESAPAIDVAGITVDRSSGALADFPDPPSAAIDSYGGGSVQDASVDDAVMRLVALGRTEAWAICVVEQLALLNAEWLLDSPTLGLGATPEEASAFVLCN